jgi:hypothetical protein
LNSNSQWKRPQTTHHRDIPDAVVITRNCHAFEGRSLAVISSVRRRGVLLWLASLPDGSRSLIPAAWTDWRLKETLPTSIDDLPHTGGRAPRGSARVGGLGARVLSWQLRVRAKLVPLTLKAAVDEPIIGIDGAVTALGTRRCVARPFHAKTPLFEDRFADWPLFIPTL